MGSNVASSDQRKNLLVRYEKVLARFQFLELLLRIADQRFKQSGEVHSMTEAIRRLLAQVEPLASARLNDMDVFFTALHTDAVDDVYRKHLANLSALHQRFCGRRGQASGPARRFMAYSQFQDLVETIGAYDSEFQQRQCGVAFRMGMMTREDEYYDTRFQEMSLLEYFHALGAVVFLRAGFAPERMADLLDEFFSDRLSRVLRGATSVTRSETVSETHGSKDANAKNACR